MIFLLEVFFTTLTELAS